MPHPVYRFCPTYIMFVCLTKLRQFEVFYVYFNLSTPSGYFMYQTFQHSKESAFYPHSVFMFGMEHGTCNMEQTVRFAPYHLS